MKKFAKYLTLLALTALFVSPLLALDNKENKEKGKGKGKDEAQLLEATFKKLEEAELTDEQKTKVTELVKQWHGQIADASGKAKLTKEQKEKMAEAKKAAVAAGKKGKEVATAAQEAAGLSQEQRDAQAAVEKLHNDFNTAVLALLSQEQKEKVNAKPKKGDKKKKNDEAKTE